MRIAFCGKGGSGKTTMASLFIRYLVAKGEQVMAIDGDINQHLAEALGLEATRVDEKYKLGQRQDLLQAYVKGDNERIRNADDIIESTPAGRGSGFVDFSGDDAVSRDFILRQDNLRFLAVGGHEEHDIGTTCFHKFSGAEGIFLNHLLDRGDEFVVADKCAGADPFASSGLASRYDAIFLVLEPTLKSLAVYEQARRYADPFGIRLYTIANKVTSPEDIAFIAEKTGQEPVVSFATLKTVQDFERGVAFDILNQSADILDNLEKLRQIALSLGDRDWKKYQENGLFFHKRAAEGWASAMLGTDLMEQVDPEFSYEDLMAQWKKAA